MDIAALLCHNFPQGPRGEAAQTVIVKLDYR